MTIETKFNIGDKVYSFEWNKPLRATIIGVQVIILNLESKNIEYLLQSELTEYPSPKMITPHFSAWRKENYIALTVDELINLYK
jgi:hypothetical protein